MLGVWKLKKVIKSPCTPAKKGMHKEHGELFYDPRSIEYKQLTKDNNEVTIDDSQEAEERELRILFKKEQNAR